MKAGTRHPERVAPGGSTVVRRRCSRVHQPGLRGRHTGEMTERGVLDEVQTGARRAPALLAEWDEELLAESPEDEEAAELAALLALESRRYEESPDDVEQPEPATPPVEVSARRGARGWARPGDLPELVEPPGYFRDRAGRWRYRFGGDLVPGARDLTLGRLWRFTRQRGAVLVPVELAGWGSMPGAAPELAWCPGVASDLTHVQRPRAVAVGEGPIQQAWQVPLSEWRARISVPLGLDAPELTIDRLLDVEGVARLAGVAAGTVRSYVARGYLPQPVRVLGGSPLWSVPVVLRALAARPGRGRRVGDARRV